MNDKPKSLVLTADEVRAALGIDLQTVKGA